MRSMHILCLSVTLVICRIGGVKSEAFSSTANLVQLVDGEQQILDRFETYVQDEEWRIASLRGALDDMKKAKADIAVTDTLHYAGHPISAYNLIRRWHQITTYISNEKNANKFKEQYKGLPVPTVDDYNGATAALIRLQRVFAMKTEDMIRGYALTEKSPHKLDSQDFYAIGNMAFKNQDLGLAAEWLEKASEHTHTNAVATIIYKNLAKCNKEFKDYDKAAEYAEKAYQISPTVKAFMEGIKEEAEIMSSSSNPPPKANATTWDRNLPDWKINYEKLCRGELDATSDPSYTKDLVCRYRRSILPYYVFKEEILSWDPRIGMFYDVISDEDSNKVIDRAYPLLYRAVVGDPAKAFKSDERISKVAWLWDKDDTFIKRMSKKVKLITGLETEFSDRFSKSEPFQVVNYGMGGQYEPHVDYYEDPNELANVPSFIKNTGDRIATFLFYLSTINHGGATVYPRSNIRVPPIKNAAAFWYNYKLNGDEDKRTEHAGCPVLIGQKWVINKWIRQYGQEWTRPCGLSVDDIDTS